MNRLQFRIILFYFLIFLGILTLATGLLLYAWPHGFRSGQATLGGLTKEGWISVHTYITLLLIPFFLGHVSENRKCVRVYLDLTVRGKPSAK
jgi:hypothetical protein